MNYQPNTQCLYCQTPLYRESRYIKKQKYIACESCRTELFSDIAINKAKKQYQDFIQDWQLGLKEGTTGQRVSHHIRKYLFAKYDNRCCRCGWSQINPTSMKIPLQVNHIDGNPTNSTESNLELICPNCHSLTPNYMGLNKGNGRKNRYREGC